MSFILWEHNANHVGTITLNRPEKHNALHGPMLEALEAALKTAATAELRLLILRGMGRNFCAGADLAWMLKMSTSDLNTNQADAELLARVLRLVHTFPVPTVVFAQGAIYGGGLGLVAAADFAITTPNSHFCLSEIKLGLIPAVISPYIIEAIGYKKALQYALTAQPFSGTDAVHLGLCFDALETFDSDPNSHHLIELLLQAGPRAQALLKPWFQEVAKTSHARALEQSAAKLLAHLRTSPEAQEGLQAFTEKRAPTWYK